MDSVNRKCTTSLPIRPSLVRRPWFAAVALAVAASFLQLELAAWLSLPGGVAVAQEAAGPRLLGLYVIPKTPKDATAAMVLKGLLRGTADRLVAGGVGRAQATPVEDPNARAVVAAKVEEGRKALATSKWDEALRLYGEAEAALAKCLGAADRAVTAKVYKGLGVAQATRNAEAAKAAMRRSNAVYPGQRADEYAYSAEARNLFAGILQEAEQAQNGGLVVTSNPAGAEVYVDFEFRGFAPAKVTGLSAGDHLVVVAADGNNLWAKFVAVKGGADEPVDVALVPSAAGKDVTEALAGAGKALEKNKPADAEAGRIAGATGATDVVILQVAMEKTAFAVNGVHWSKGAAMPLRRNLAKDATLVTATQAVLTDALGVAAPGEVQLAQLEPAPVAVPVAGQGQPMPGEGEEGVVDPNSPIFRDTGKKAGGKSIVKQWWFWVAAAAVVGGAVTGIVFLSKRGSGGSGPTGDLTLKLHGVQ